MFQQNVSGRAKVRIEVTVQQAARNPLADIHYAALMQLALDHAKLNVAVSKVTFSHRKCK